MRMRAPCPNPECMHDTGVIRERNGQDCVFCARCDRWCYNAPKSETGKPQRRVQTREAMAPAQRARVIARDGGRCWMCGDSSAILHVGHILSVIDGKALGASEDELNDDENLVTMCEACNLGLGSKSMPLRLFLLILRARAA